ncbi:unnamed protein product [Parnassius mnemosyne]|uniref:Uncharacterized protein n=1 Tax=Parnassius mnemosyne TaxID=213953 RepID=A0AAV1LFD9_9NEOP
MRAKTIFTLMGVSYFTFALCNPDADESGDTVQNAQPIALEETGERKRKLETPEVVLQLKYDRGELNRIYLAQFRKGVNKWVPSVPARRDLCTDLCHAGLGGNACGSTCPKLIPVGLQSALLNGNQSDAVYGKPRVYVCPTLCNNRLGEPLCSCPEKEDREAVREDVDWPAICETFCVTDRYVLSGCPACRETPQPTASKQLASMRVLNTVEGWSSWCNVQCRQGQGGAACNCDRAPFQ